MDIPNHLLTSIREGTVVLVMGAGASVGAVDSMGASAPTGPELARLLSDEFLGGQHNDSPLPIVAELAISESDLTTVQEYIRTLFGEIEPAPFHKFLPTFRWAGLATTNFDLVIERAYDQYSKSQQDLVPLIKNGDRVDDKLRSPRSVVLLKLHGCITRTADTSVPLILSPDQYLTHQAGRDRIFSRLQDLSFEHPFVFVGHSMQDPDIRQLLLKHGESDLRPRYYMVAPEISDVEARMWQSKRMTPMRGTFEEFLNTLDSELTSPLRGFVPTPIATDTPISERFIVRDPGLSPECLDFLENEVEYVRNGMPVEDLKPRLFYRGFNPPWAAIDSNLDVRRDIEDRILIEAVLDDDRNDVCELFTIRGHAGSGKSVLLQRIAWESALSLDKLCLYLRPHGQLSLDAVKELSSVIDERIFLFVDDIDERVSQVLDLIEGARSLSAPLTIIGATRNNEWNMACDDLEPYVIKHFELRYLSEKEIDSMLELLEQHDALFRLEKATPAERRQAFVERASRQLLVALHEATLGKPFEDIVADEFAEIEPDTARLMYLGICFLNRYDVHVRAGIISRVYRVRFTEFQDKFFQPLEGLVFARYDPQTRDYVYVTRHPHIAEIVADRELAYPGDKLDMYLQFITNMNIDYDSDRRAFRRLVRGRSLLEEFPDHRMAHEVYKVARFAARDDSYILHQLAIYEMNRPNGSLQEANRRLTEAKNLAPYDRTITHSMAELQLRRAEKADTALEFYKYIGEAERIAESLTGSSAVVSHGYHTLAKTYIAKLSKIIDADEGEITDIAFNEAIKDVENVIGRGLQRFPDDTYLLTAESDLGKLLSDDDRSIRTLTSAFTNNPHNPFIAVRLAKTLTRTDRVDEAFAIYRSALESGIVEKQVHFNYAKLLIEQRSADHEEIEYHLRRGFTQGDGNTEAQFWYSRQLYINGKWEEAQRRFRDLRNARVNPALKRKVRGEIYDGEALKKFTGRLEQLFSDYGFIIRDGPADRVYIHIGNVDESVWEKLRRYSRIWFAIGFNFWGPVAVEIGLEA